MIATVARFLDPWEAHIVRARLEAEGVPATVAFANHSIANWPMSFALGGTAVQVPMQYLEQSRNIIADYQSGRLETELHEAVGSKTEHCPSCGSLEFKRSIPWRERFLALALGLFSSAFPTSQSRLICRACGHHWQRGEG